MRRFFTILFGIVVLAYLIVAGRHCARKQGVAQVSQVRIVVRDSAQLNMVTPAAVRGWLEREGIKTRDLSLHEVDIARIRQVVEKHVFVRQATVFTDLRGRLNIELTQRRPIVRVEMANDARFYLSDDGYVLPVQRGDPVRVPIVTGSFTPPFAPGYVGKLDDAISDAQKKLTENWHFLLKLIKFVTFIEDDDFWSAEIVQIVVRESAAPVGDPAWQEPQVEIIPRAGNHVVVLGALDDVSAKLEKLLAFYRHGLAYEGWSGPKVINLKYRNQVICTK